MVAGMFIRWFLSKRAVLVATREARMGMVNFILDFEVRVINSRYWKVENSSFVFWRNWKQNRVSLIMSRNHTAATDETGPNFSCGY
jgi:hypothetical protein